MSENTLEHNIEDFRTTLASPFRAAVRKLDDTNILPLIKVAHGIARIADAVEGVHYGIDNRLSDRWLKVAHKYRENKRAENPSYQGDGMGLGWEVKALRLELIDDAAKDAAHRGITRYAAQDDQLKRLEYYQKQNYPIYIDETYMPFAIFYR